MGSSHSAPLLSGSTDDETGRFFQCSQRWCCLCRGEPGVRLDAVAQGCSSLWHTAGRAHSLSLFVPSPSWCGPESYKTCHNNIYIWYKKKVILTLQKSFKGHRTHKPAPPPPFPNEKENKSKIKIKTPPCAHTHSTICPWVLIQIPFVP